MLTWDALAIVLLVAVFAVVFSLVRMEPLGSDDCSYFEIATGREFGSVNLRYRYTVLAVVRLAQVVFGYSGTAYYATAFAHSLGLLLACYALGRMLMGVLPSLLAAFLLLGVPEFLENGTRILPDIPTLFWFVLGLVVFLRALELETPSLPLKHALLSGLCFYLAVSAKESSVTLLFAVICIPVATSSKRAWRLFVAVGAGALACALVELLFFWIAFGDPLHRLEAVEASHVRRMYLNVRLGDQLAKQIDWGYLATRFLTVIAEDADYTRIRLFGVQYSAWLLICFAIAGVGAALCRQRLWFGLLGIAVMSYLMLTFSVISFDPLIPSVQTKSRYFLVVLVWVPTLILGGWVALWKWVVLRAPPTPQHLSTGVAALGISLSTALAHASAKSYIESGRTIRNGHTPLGDLKAPVLRFARSHEVKRLVGPYVVRGAAFLWPERSFEVIGHRRSSLKGKLLPGPGDLFVARYHPALQGIDGAFWREVGKSNHLKLYHLTAFDTPQKAGQVSLLAASRRELKKHARGRLAIKLELQAEGVQLRPVTVWLHGAPPSWRRDHLAPMRKLQALRLERRGDVYTLEVSTKAFRTDDLYGVTLTFRSKGKGTFVLRERRFDLVGK